MCGTGAVLVGGRAPLQKDQDERKGDRLWSAAERGDSPQQPEAVCGRKGERGGVGGFRRRRRAMRDAGTRVCGQLAGFGERNKHIYMWIYVDICNMRRYGGMWP